MLVFFVTFYIYYVIVVEYLLEFLFNLFYIRKKFIIFNFLYIIEFSHFYHFIIYDIDSDI